jgi:hypothetical protein
LTGQKCEEAEAKVLLIMEWVNTALATDDSTSSDSAEGAGLPTLVVSQDQHDDFSPAPTPNKQSTITLSANKMTRAQLSHIDLAGFNSKFGTLTLSGKGRAGLGAGVRMLREESGFGLSEIAAGDEEEY